MSGSVNTRELVTEILLSIDKGEEHSHILIKGVLDKYDYLPQADKSFIKRVVTGTLENRIKIDYVINYFSKTPVNKMKPIIRNIIRMSVYQIMYMDKVPDSAVCNEAVKLAGKRGFKGLQGFVNGLLRGIIRGIDNIKWPEPAGSVRAISVKYSCPELIVESLINDYGREQTALSLAASLGESNLYVRIDESLSEDKVTAIKKEWDDNGISYEVSDSLSYAYKLKGVENLSRLPLFDEGCYSVMDLSSMYVAEMADVKAGSKVLDICAAPGGKSLHMACKLKSLDKDNQGMVISRDVSEYKTDLIDENISRLKAENIRSEVYDATVYDASIEGSMDVVIADVPCSGIGVIGRKPDIKYNLTAEGLDEIITLQREIIDNAVRYVKKGGILMYSTCTMRKAENDENVRYILNKGGFKLDSDKQLFITADNDGFYIARLIKED